MRNETKRRHYIAVLPLWLVETLKEQDLPFSTALSLADLSGILSVEDVCFYYHYQLKTNFFTDDAFKDMENVVYNDDNFAWLSANLETVNKCGSTFNISFEKGMKDITTNAVSSTVRKCAYAPSGHSNNVLLLAATTEGMSYDRKKFYSDCMGVLSSQIGANNAENFAVFERYTQS